MNKQELIHRFLTGQSGKNHNAMAYVDTDGSRILKLHFADIVMIKDRKAYFDNGGWETKTTKSYMNMVLKEISSYYIQQIKGNWFFNGMIPFDHVEYLSLDDGCLKIKAGGMNAYGFTAPSFNLTQSLNHKK